MDDKKRKLKELLILEDEKSLLLADKIDAVGEKVSESAKEAKDIAAGIIDHTEKLDKIMKSIEEMENEEIEVSLDIK